MNSGIWCYAHRVFLIYVNTEEIDGFHAKISIFAGGVGGEVRKTGMTCETNFIASMETLRRPWSLFRRVRKIAKSDY